MRSTRGRALCHPPPVQVRRAKIVCTIGPACDDQSTLEQLIRAGMDVARLNFSHGSHEDHARNFATIRGMMSFFYMWGSFAGPVMAGAIYDRTQSYLAVLWILLALLLFATLLVLFLIRPWTKRMAMLAPASCP